MSRNPARGGQAGETLVELLLAVSLLGTASVGLLFGFGTLIRSSDIARRGGNAGTVLTAAAEAVADNGRNAYQPVCQPSYDPVLGVTIPATVTDVVVVPPVRHWNGSAFTDQCDDAALANRLQLLTVRVVTAAGASTAEVVKRG